MEFTKCVWHSNSIQNKLICLRSCFGKAMTWQFFMLRNFVQEMTVSKWSRSCSVLNRNSFFCKTARTHTEASWTRNWNILKIAWLRPQPLVYFWYRLIGVDRKWVSKEIVVLCRQPSGNTCFTSVVINLNSLNVFSRAFL